MGAACAALVLMVLAMIGTVHLESNALQSSERTDAMGRHWPKAQAHVALTSKLQRRSTLPSAEMTPWGALVVGPPPLDAHGAGEDAGLALDVGLATFGAPKPRLSGLTPCVGPPAHDAAHGEQVFHNLPPPRVAA